MTDHFQSLEWKDLLSCKSIYFTFSKNLDKNPRLKNPWHSNSSEVSQAIQEV